MLSIWLQARPAARRRADAHELAGVEPKRPERYGALDDRLRLVNIDPGRGEGDFQRQARGMHGAAGRVSLFQNPPYPLAAVHLGSVGVEAHLHRAHRQRGESVRHGGVDALAIGFNLELHTSSPKDLGDGEEMRHDQWLASTQHDVRYVTANDFVRHADRGRCIELVREFLTGSRVGAAVQAA